MRDEIASLYMKVGLKNVASVFLISDAQLPDESILMLINDLLASGEIPELFNDDQLDTIINGIRNEVKQSGTLDTKDNCWRYFVEKVRRLLKVVLCFSPVGQTLRIRARKFPAIISRTAIDWFHEWPKSALESVSQKFLNEISDILEVQLYLFIYLFICLHNLQQVTVCPLTHTHTQQVIDTTVTDSLLRLFTATTHTAHRQLYGLRTRYRESDIENLSTE